MFCLPHRTQVAADTRIGLPRVARNRARGFVRQAHTWASGPPETQKRRHTLASRGGLRSVSDALPIRAAPLRRQAGTIFIPPGLPGNVKEPRTWRGWEGDRRQPPDGFGIPGVVPRFAPSLQERRGGSRSGRPCDHIDKRPGFEVALQW